MKGLDKLNRSKKCMEMTMQTIAVIVIILVLIVIVLYVLWGRSQTFAQSTSCPEEDCKTSSESCSPRTKGLVACSKIVGDTKKVGRCCVDA